MNYDQMYVNKLENLHETAKFLERHRLLKMVQEEMEKSEQNLINNETELVIWSPMCQRKHQGCKEKGRRNTLQVLLSVSATVTTNSMPSQNNVYICKLSHGPFGHLSNQVFWKLKT